MRLDLLNSWVCYLHFFIEIFVKQNINLDIFRHVESTNDIVWGIEGFRGWQFNRYKPIFILQLIRTVELMLFIKKIVILILLWLTTMQFNFSRISSVYCCQMWKYFSIETYLVLILLFIKPPSDLKNRNHLLPEPVLLSLFIDLSRHTVLQNPSFSIPNTRLLQESASIKSTALDRIDCYRVRSVQISCKIAISSHQKTSQRARISLIFHKGVSF